MRFMITNLRRTGAGLVALVAIGCVHNRNAHIEKTPLASEQGGWLRKFPYLTSNTSRHSVFDDPSQWPAKPSDSVVQSRFAQMFPNLSKRTSNRTFDGQTAIAGIAAETARDAASATAEAESIRPETNLATGTEVEPGVRTTAGIEAPAASESVTRPISKAEWSNLSANSVGVAAVVAALAATSDIEEHSGPSSASPSTEVGSLVPDQGVSERSESVRIASRPQANAAEQVPPPVDAVDRIVTPPLTATATTTQPTTTGAANGQMAATSESKAASSEAPAPPAAEMEMAKSPQAEPAAGDESKASSEVASTSTDPSRTAPATPEIPAIPSVGPAPVESVQAASAPVLSSPGSVPTQTPEIPAIPTSGESSSVSTTNPAPPIPTMVAQSASNQKSDTPAKPAQDVPTVAVNSKPVASVEPGSAPEIPAIPAASTNIPAIPAPEIPASIAAVPQGLEPSPPAIPATEVPADAVKATPMISASPAIVTERPASSEPAIPSIPNVPASASVDVSRRPADAQAAEPAVAIPPAAPVAEPPSQPTAVTDNTPSLSPEPVAAQGYLAIPAVPAIPDSAPVPASKESALTVPELAKGGGSRSVNQPEPNASLEIPALPPAPANLSGMLEEPPLPTPAPEMKIPGVTEAPAGAENPANAPDAVSPTDAGIEKSSGSVQAASDQASSEAARTAETAPEAVPVANPEANAPKLEQAPASSPETESEIPVLHPLPDDESVKNVDSAGSVLQRKPGEIVIQLRLKNPLRMTRFWPTEEEAADSEKPSRSLKSAAKNLFAWQRRTRSESEAADDSVAKANAAPEHAEMVDDRLNSNVGSEAVHAVQAEVVPPNSNEAVAASTSQVPDAASTANSVDHAEVPQESAAPLTESQPSVAIVPREASASTNSPSGGAAYYVPGRVAPEAPKVRLSNGLPPVEFPSSYHAARPRSANPWHAHAKPAVNLVADPRSGIAPSNATASPAPAAAPAVPVTRREAWPQMKPDLEVVRTSLNVAAPKAVPARTSTPEAPRSSQPEQSWWSKSGKGLRSLFFGEEEVVPAKRPSWAKQSSTIR